MKAFNFLKKIIVTLFVFCVCETMIFSQGIEMPSMEMPSMPSISFPTMDGTFYHPSLPQQIKKSTSDNEKSSTDQNAPEATLSDATTTEDLLLSLITNSNMLSASDISGLYDTGMFYDISSLTGSSSLYSSTQNLTNSLMLKEILNSLEELKSEQKKNTPAQQEEIEAKQTDSQTFKTRNPSILRFKINNYNIKDTIKDVFFSELEADGSFLFTADRKYFVNTRSCTETFYMLFKAEKSNGSSTTYSVTASIAQSFENKSSYVYKLCQQKNITAEKTGNLVVIHYDHNDLTADILLDVDK